MGKISFNKIGWIYRIRVTNRFFSVMMVIAFASVLIDTSLSKVYCLSSCSTAPIQSIVTILGLVFIYSIVQRIILIFIRRRGENRKLESDLHIGAIYRAVEISQYGLIALLSFIIYQIIFLSYYNTVLLMLITTISYAVAAALLTILSHRFLSWFRLKRNHVVLLYGLSALSIAINAVISIAFVDTSLLVRPQEVREYLVMSNLFIAQSSSLDMLNQAYVASSIISFLATWLATAVLLLNYSKKLGMIRYWIIISLPVIYFLVQFIGFLLNIIAPLVNTDPVFYGTIVTLVFVMSKPAGGLLFGISFWIVARSTTSSAVRSYMNIAAFGFLLLFTSNQAIVLVDVPYPPLGTVTVSYVNLSSYLILLGIYSCAISVAQDSSLRQSIRNIAIQKTKLLDSIGSAHMELALTRQALNLTKKFSDRMAEESGVQSSLDEQDVKEYLNTVLNELNKSKKGIHDSGNKA